MQMGTNPRETPGHFYARDLSGEVLNGFSALGLGLQTRQDNDLSIKSLSVEDPLIKNDFFKKMTTFYPVLALFQLL